MFSTLRTRYGIPGLIATLALVFAMTGGAFAAKYLITSPKQIKPSVLKKLKGAKGPAGADGVAGPVGAVGPAGATGPQGSAGQNGSDGADGRTVLNGTATPTAADGVLGDFYIETDVSKIYGPKAESGANDGWGTGTNLKGANGAPGSPWTAGGTLPSEATETGSWASVIGSQEIGFGSISFAIPLAAELDAAHVINMQTASPAQKENCENLTHTGTASVSNPEAKPGYLCVYAAAGSIIGFVTKANKAFEAGAATAGATVISEAEGEEELIGAPMKGTWAVTAP